MLKSNLLLPAVLALVAGASSASALSPPDPALRDRLAAEGRLDPLLHQLRSAEPSQQISASTPTPWSKGGPVQFHALVILVDFVDKPAQGNYQAADYHDRLFSQGTQSPGSMTDFYLENSYGNFLMTGDVVGWYTMPQPYNYYVNTDGIDGTPDDHGNGPGPNNVRTLTAHAVAAADPDVNFQDYRNGSANVSGVFIVHAGLGAEQTGDPSDIWSHFWTVSVSTDDGTNVISYSTEPEYRFGGLTDMGVFAHEFGHVLGLPDLYDIDGSSGGVGRWSLMAGGSWNGGGHSPAHLDAWSKSAVGFVDPVEPASNQADVVLPPAETSGESYRLQTIAHDTNEYLLLENRQRTGFDSSLPHHGLLVWHVDGAVATNTDESCGPGVAHPIVRLIQADGNCSLEAGGSGDSGDPFPGSTNNSQLGATSSPSSRVYAGFSSGILLENIVEVAGDVQLEITLDQVLTSEVPGDYSSLGEAVAASGVGDEIRLMGGAVHEGFVELPRGIHITGGWDPTFSFQDPGQPTILRGTSGPVVRITGDLGTAVLDNLVVEDGDGRLFLQPVQAYYGGGVLLEQGSVHITRTRFQNNVAGPNLSDPAWGGAVAGLFSGSILIEDCTFAGNVAREGCAIYSAGTAVTVESSTFEGSSVYALASGVPQRGGAILMEAGDLILRDSSILGYDGVDEGGAVWAGGGASLLVEGSRFESNQADLQGGAVFSQAPSSQFLDAEFVTNSSGTFGGALYLANGLISLSGGFFETNQSGVLGGALYLADVLPGSRLGSSILRTNQATFGAGGAFVTGGSWLMEHLVFHGNSAAAAGGLQVTASDLLLRNSIFLENQGGAVAVANPVATALDHNLYWGTTAGADVAGVPMGAASVVADPLLVDASLGDYHLGAGSPALDAGDPTGPVDFDGGLPDVGRYGGVDDPGQRPARLTSVQATPVGSDVQLDWMVGPLGTAPATTRVYAATGFAGAPRPADQIAAVAAPIDSWVHADAPSDLLYLMGAVDAQGRAGGYHAPVGPGVTSVSVPTIARLGEAYPNPFNPSTTIRLLLDRPGRVEASLFDLQGRLVRRLLAADLTAGQHLLRWQGLDGSGDTVVSGTYLLRVVAPGLAETRRLILVR